MKIFLFFLLTHFFALQVNAQKKRSFDLTKFRHTEVRLEPEKSEPVALLSFSGVEVYDRRTDTSLLGFYKISQHNKSTEGILKTKLPASKSIQKFIEAQINFDPQSEMKLIFIIRKLWVAKEIENKGVNDNNAKMQKALLPGVIACIEFYAKQHDTYIPLYRFDSTILHYKKKLQFINEELLETILKESILAISKNNYLQKIENGAKYSWAQVDSFSRQFADRKILRATAYKKGVYSSYNEFINDQPSIMDFEIRKTTFSQALFVKDENGIEYPIRKIWGFSDGEHLFIKSADLFFQLEKYNNNFYCWATKNISMVTKISAGDVFLSLATGVARASDSGRKTQAAVFLKLYQLDLETGVLY